MPETSPHFPPGHPKVPFGRIASSSSISAPRSDRLLVDARLSEGISFGPARHRSQSRGLVAVLNLIVLTKRPGPKGKDYETIWNKDLNEGPLKTITRGQAEKLAAAISGDDERLVIDWAMRYGKPSIPDRLNALQQQGCERILIVPLYPQYAAATTATVCDKAFDALKKMRWQPIIRVAPPWHDDPVYIEAACASLKQHLAALDFEPEVILASFHGVPKSYLMKGDPYHCQCAKTARLMREHLGSARKNSASPSSRASARRNGSSPTPTRRWRRWRKAG